MVESMRGHIQALVDDFIDAVADKGRFDVVHDLAFPLPATVITEMLGVSPGDKEKLKAWSDDFVIFFSTHPANISIDQYRRAQESMRAMTASFREAVGRLGDSSRESLLKLMQAAEEQGSRLTEEELFANANLLLIAGHETTTNLITNGMLALLRHPDQLYRLQSDPSAACPTFAWKATKSNMPTTSICADRSRCR
jgi:cytochrome P450